MCSQQLNNRKELSYELSVGYSVTQRVNCKPVSVGTIYTCHVCIVYLPGIEDVSQ